MAIERPLINERGSSSYRYAELVTLLGPAAIGVTGDNRYETLFGRPYVVAVGRDRIVRAYRGAAEGGSYERVTAGLPANIFGPALPATARRLTAAFDQSARLVVAYEDTADGNIRVTRWTGSEYVQNVTFAGRDPQLLMDATLADPRGYPTAADGWSVREAIAAGMRVTFEWLAEEPPTYRDNPVTDSDVVLFYLAPDRESVRARVQRQLYATELEIAALGAPAVLDRAIALAGRYELLLGDAAGDPLPNVLVSDPYLGDFLIAAATNDAVGGTLAPAEVAVVRALARGAADDGIATTLAPEAITVVLGAVYRSISNAVNVSLAQEAIAVVAALKTETDADGIDGGLATEASIPVVVTLIPTGDDDALDTTLEPESIRVQTV